MSAPGQALRAGAAVLERSIVRGDWDEETCDVMSAAAGALYRASDSGEPAVLEEDVADELVGILGSDAAADGVLAPLLEALEDALAR